MSRPSPIGAALLAVVSLASRAEPADPAPAAPPRNYAAVMVGSTLAYHPHEGEWDGFQHDVSPMIGYGRYLNPKIAVELDLGPTFVRGDYTSFAFVPAVVYAFSSHAYLAGRFLVPVDPEVNFGLFPGIGVFTTKGRYSPYLELNLSSYVGRGKPDLGVSLTAGVLISF
jgi:hypothetical protein